MIRLAILMTVHNRKQQTLSCLQSVYGQKLAPEIAISTFLTNDGCTDGTEQAVAQQFPQVTIIEGDGTLFWNRGMLRAWEAAERTDFDYYLWLNDDVLLHTDSLARLVECSARYDDKAIVVGTCCASKDSKRATYGGQTRGKFVFSESADVPCETMNGNLVLIPRHTYRRIGKLDPHYHHACGDFDYGWRTTRQGEKIVVAKGFFGICDTHERAETWADASQPLHKRWHAFFANHRASDTFRLFRRNKSLATACFKFATSLAHILTPKLYNRLTNK